MRIRYELQRIRHRLIVMILLLSLSLIAIVILVMYRSTTDIIRLQSITLNNKLVELGKNNIEKLLHEVDKIYPSIYLNTSFKKFTSPIALQNDYEFNQTYTDIKNMMYSFVNSRQDIFSMVYIDNRGFLIFTTRSEAGYIKTYSTEPLPEQLRESFQILYENNEKLILPSYEHIPLDFRVSAQQTYVISVARSIINIDQDFGVLGAMYINLDLSALRLIANEIKPYPDALTYILSDEGVVVYDSAEQQIGSVIGPEVLNSFGKRQQGETQVTMNGERWMAVYTTSEATGWKVVNMIPEHEYTANVSVLTKVIIVVCLFAVLITIVITYLVSRYISNPIEHLTKVMNDTNIDNMTIRVDERRRDEIGILSRSFNRLIAKLQNSISSEYEARIRQQEAELKALQSQINPHFLNNVLQSMSTIALVQNVGEISIMAKSLGKMLRYNIEMNVNLVAIRAELEHATSYLTIQKIRFGDKLEYKLDVPEYLKEYAMLKFTLQPIIENAIVHGFRNKTDRGIVHILCAREGNRIRFEISDNGCGLPAEYLKGLLSEESSGGIGLSNVKKRLQLVYGDQAELNIESEEHVGTTVIILIPMEKERKGGVLNWR